MDVSAKQTRSLKVIAATLAIAFDNTQLPTVNAVPGRAGASANCLSAWSRRHPALTRAIVLGIGAIALAVIFGLMYMFATVAIYTQIALLPIIGIAAAIVARQNGGAITGWFAGRWAG